MASKMKSSKERFWDMDEKEFVKQFGIVLVKIHEGYMSGHEIAEQLDKEKEGGKIITFTSEGYISEILNHFAEPVLKYVRRGEIKRERGNPCQWELTKKGQNEVNNRLRERKEQKIDEGEEERKEKVIQQKQKMLPLGEYTDKLDMIIHVFDERFDFSLQRIKNMARDGIAVHRHKSLMNKLHKTITEAKINPQDMNRVVLLYCELWERCINTYSSESYEEDKWLDNAPYNQLWEISRSDKLSKELIDDIRVVIRKLFKHYLKKNEMPNGWLKDIVIGIVKCPRSGGFNGHLLHHCIENKEEKRTIVSKLDKIWWDGKYEYNEEVIELDEHEKNNLDKFLNHSELVDYREIQFSDE